MRVEVVDDLLEDQDAREDDRLTCHRREVGHGIGLQGRLRRVQLAAVPQAEPGEEPHVFVLFADEVVQKLRDVRIGPLVDAHHHFAHQFTDAVNVEAEEVDRFVLGQLQLLITGELVPHRRTRQRGQTLTHPRLFGLDLLGPVENRVRIVVAGFGHLLKPVQVERYRLNISYGHVFSSSP
nr:hypothetical protein [Streptomyces sp. HB202]